MNLTSGKREVPRKHHTFSEVITSPNIVRRNNLRRTYDRLRKRSLRRRDWINWKGTDHKAYVAGVRDALNSVMDN